MTEDGTPRIRRPGAPVRPQALSAIEVEFRQPIAPSVLTDPSAPAAVPGAADLSSLQRLLHKHGLASAEYSFRRATEQAPEYAQAWFAQGEFVYHFGDLFDQPLTEAENAFSRVLDLDNHFAPAIAHLMSLTYLLHDDKRETQRLIREYLHTDSTSVVAEAVGIADTVIFGSLVDRSNLLKHVEAHSTTALEFLAYQAAQFGTEEQRRGPARRILRAFERRASTDPERVQALRMGVAADLRAGWADSARARLGRAKGAATARERDTWLVLAHATGLPSLGDWRAAANRLEASPRLPGGWDAVEHWVLARAGVARAEHVGALRRLAADSAPLPWSLGLDLAARDALAQQDTTRALSLWSDATRRYAVLGAPLGLVASLWPLRLDIVRVTLARGDLARAEATCGTFDALIGYVDQVALPEIERLCARWRPQAAPATPHQ